MSHAHFQVEHLESRTLLSISAADCVDVSLTARGDSELTHFFACQRLEKSLPRLVGRYRGKVVTALQPRPVEGTMIIRRQSVDGTIEGTVSAAGLGSFDLSARADLSPDGTFAFTYSQNGLTGTLQGRVTKARGLRGTIVLTQEALPIPLTGAFSLKRLAKGERL